MPVIGIPKFSDIKKTNYDRNKKNIKIKWSSHCVFRMQ